MALLPLLQGSGHERKKGIRARFSNLRMRHPLKLEYELNHASRLPTSGVTKFNTKRVCLDGNSQEKCLDDNQGISHWKFPGKALWVANGSS